jgi:4-hydroxybenzoate polyprenyltransferase
MSRVAPSERAATVRRLVLISRPVLWINTIGSGLVAVWLTGALFDLRALPVILWLTLPFNLLIYGVNDIYDQDTDAANPRKGSIEGARIRQSEVPSRCRRSRSPRSCSTSASSSSTPHRRCASRRGPSSTR